MIEINLLPGTTRRSKRRLPRLALPNLKRGESEPGPGGGSSVDRWVLVMLLAWVLGPGVVGWMFLDTRSHKAELEVAIEGARLDSIRYAEMRKANEIMQARQDTIMQKLEIIQQIDAHRYTWAHIVDEVSRAVPQYTWLVNILATSLSVDETVDGPTFTIDGRTGTPFALAEYMKRLESSPFLRNVTLVQTDQIRENEQLMYSFVLEVKWEAPTPEILDMVPLFQRGDD